MKDRRALTLVELLVIVFVLAIILGLFLPWHRCGREARKTACKSNLKNIGLLCSMYCQDYDGGFGFWDGSVSTPRENFYILFSTHVATEPALFICPSSGTVVPTLSTPPKPSDFSKTDYAYYDGDLSALKEALSTTATCGDAWGGHSDPYDGKWTHPGGSNILWGDGHVSWEVGKYVGVHGPYTDVK